jgi:endonuclease YncB( thermonuclease family)
MRRREFVTSVGVLTATTAIAGEVAGEAVSQPVGIDPLTFDSTCSLLASDGSLLTDDSTVAVWAEETATNADEDGNGDATDYGDTAIPLVAVDGNVVGLGAPIVKDEDNDFTNGNEEFLLNVFDETVGSGTVLWDGSHNQYWTLDRHANFESYAEENGYTLEAVGADGDLTDRLSEADAVVITAPSSGFTDAERTALDSFVSNGGALFLVDQSDFNDFDETAKLNALADTLGLSFRFNDDQVLDDQNNAGVSYVPTTSNVNTDFPFFADREGISTGLDLQKGETYEVAVESVADGDTVSVRFPNDQVEEVRVLGVDTPETASSAQFERPEEWEGLGRRRPVLSNLTFGSTSSLLNAQEAPLTDDSTVAVWAEDPAANEDSDGNDDAVSYPDGASIPLAAVDGQVAGFGAILVDDDGGDRTFDSANEQFLLNVWDQLAGRGSTVLFDDGHGQFFDSSKFSEFTSYTESSGYTVESTTDVAADLPDADAVVITSPGDAFSDDERTALSAFVDAGGAVFLHDQSDFNDFDQTANLNAIADALDLAFRFNDDQVVDDQNNAGQPFLPTTTQFNTSGYAFFGDRAGLGDGESDPDPNYPYLADWADRASTFAGDELQGETAELTFDENEPIRDPFDRLLGYLRYDADDSASRDTLYNRALIENGFARVYGSSLSRHESFRDAEQAARASGTGLWAQSDPGASPPIRDRPVDALFFPSAASVVTDSGTLADSRVPVAAAPSASQQGGSVTASSNPALSGVDEDAGVAMVGAPIVDESYEASEGFAVDTSGYENFVFLTNLLDYLADANGDVLIDGGHGQFAVDYALSSEDAAYYQRYLEGQDIGFEQVNAITEDNLSRGRALLVTTPVDSFSDDEVSAISSFVDGGGAVVLLGSAAAPSDARSNLNDLAASLGTDLRLNDDQVVDSQQNVNDDQTVPGTGTFDDSFPLFEAYGGGSGDDGDDGDDGGAPTEPTVQVSLPDGPLAEDVQTTGEIVLSSAPDGLAGFEVTVEVDDPDVATVEFGSYPGEFGRLVTDSDGGKDGTATFEAVDTDDAITPGATDVTLARFVVTGSSPGETDLTVSVEAMDDDEGAAIDPETSGAAVFVSDLEPVVGDSLPTDPDGDGKYEDVDGDGELTFNDVEALFENDDSDAVTDNVDAFDFNQNSRIDYDDIVELFDEV